MAIILALDTSTEACSCAVNRDGEITEEFALIPRQHAQNILPMIQSLMAKQDLRFTDLDAIAFGQGPGSFTGLRIAAGVTQGVASAANLPVIAISTLSAMAWYAWVNYNLTNVLTCLDARIDELYWSCTRFQQFGAFSKTADALCKPELLDADIVSSLFGDQDFAVLGSGLNYQQRFPRQISIKINRTFPEILPSAASISVLAEDEWRQGNTVSAEFVQPLYLRDKVTHQ